MRNAKNKNGFLIFIYHKPMKELLVRVEYRVIRVDGYQQFLFGCVYTGQRCIRER